MDAYTGLFAMTTVKNQYDIINAAWGSKSTVNFFLLGNAWWYINNKLLDELSIKKDNLLIMEAYLV